MTRVLMIAPTPFFSDRGCHVRIYEEALELQRRGAEVRLVSYPLGLDPPGIDVRRAARWVPFHRTAAGPSWLRPPLDAAVLASAIAECRRFRPDIIHAHLHEGAAIGFILKRMFRLPLVFDYQGSLTGETIQHGFIKAGGILHAALASLEKTIDTAADVVVTSSGPLSRALLSRGIRARPLPDGVDSTRFCPGEPDPSLLSSLVFGPADPLCVYLGVMSDYQGVDILLRSAQYLKAGAVRARLLLMGYPEDEYRQEAQRLGLGSMVRFTGRVGYFDAPRHLRLGTIALAPKLASTEANGKVLTYMATGLPVVAFDLPINREILGDAAEWVSAQGDRAELARNFAAGIARLLGDSERRQALGAAGRQRAAELFSIHLQGESLLKIYAGLAR